MLLEDLSIFVLLGIGFIVGIIILVQHGNVIRRQLDEFNVYGKRHRTMERKLKVY